jgi:hypothetical protein
MFRRVVRQIRCAPPRPLDLPPEPCSGAEPGHGVHPRWGGCPAPPARGRDLCLDPLAPEGSLAARPATGILTRAAGDPPHTRVVWIEAESGPVAAPSRLQLPRPGHAPAPGFAGLPYRAKSPGRRRTDGPGLPPCRSGRVTTRRSRPRWRPDGLGHISCARSSFQLGRGDRLLHQRAQQVAITSGVVRVTGRT